MTLIIEKNSTVTPYRAGGDAAVIHITPDTPFQGTADNVTGLDIFPQAMGVQQSVLALKSGWDTPIRHIPDRGFMFSQGNYLKFTLPLHMNYLAVSVHVAATLMVPASDPATIDPSTGQVYANYDNNEEIVFAGLTNSTSGFGWALDSGSYNRLRLDWPGKLYNSEKLGGSGAYNVFDYSVAKGHKTSVFGMYFDNQKNKNDPNQYGGATQLWHNGQNVLGCDDNGVPMRSYEFVMGRSVFGIIHEIIFYARTDNPGDTLMPSDLSVGKIQKELMEKWV